MRPDDDFNANAALVRADVLVLLREKRYEDALAVLYRARSESPESTELQKSIDQIKEFLVGAYAKRLGGLDQIAKPVPPGITRTPDVVLLSRYIDGRSTFGDIAQMSPLGQLRTLQVLVSLYPKIEVATSGEQEAPRSGLRAPSSIPERPSTGAVADLDDEPVPDTARSASFTAPVAVIADRSPVSVPISVPAPVPASAPAPISVGLPAQESDADRNFRETLTRGTMAFVQRRYQDAVDAFEACLRLRPLDNGATGMLRRALRDRDLESR